MAGEAADVGGIVFVGEAREQLVAIHADAAIELLLRKPVDRTGADRIAQRQVPHDADDAEHAGQPLAVMTGCEVEQPLVVLQP